MWSSAKARSTASSAARWRLACRNRPRTGPAYPPAIVPAAPPLRPPRRHATPPHRATLRAHRCALPLRHVQHPSRHPPGTPPQVGAVGTLIATFVKRDQVKDRLKCPYCEGTGIIQCAHRPAPTPPPAAHHPSPRLHRVAAQPKGPPHTSQPPGIGISSHLAPYLPPCTSPTRPSPSLGTYEYACSRHADAMHTPCQVRAVPGQLTARIARREWRGASRPRPVSPLCGHPAPGPLPLPPDPRPLPPAPRPLPPGPGPHSRPAPSLSPSLQPNAPPADTPPPSPSAS